MSEKQDEAEESAWPKTREALMEGLQRVLMDSKSSAYLIAQSEARLRGLKERADADARWKAMALMRTLSSGAYLWGVVSALEQAGESWEAIGPLVFKEWLFLIEGAARREHPLARCDADAPGLREARPWVWLNHALTLSQAGWASYGFGGPQSASERAPLGEAEQQEMARVYLKMREAVIESERKAPGWGVLSEFQGIFPLPYWTSEAEATAYFESVTERAKLESETPPGVKRAIGRRV